MQILEVSQIVIGGILKSIITENECECYLCGKTDGLQLHHIFGASDRVLSEKYGLKVPLCWNCHHGTRGAHGTDGAETQQLLHLIGQSAFIHFYPELDFNSIFRKSYKD